MNKSRIAQTLRNLSVTASLESDVDASIETGPAGEGTVKENLEEAQVVQTDAEIGESEDKDLTVKTVEVGERSELESAETESTDSVVSQEGIEGAVKGFAIGTAGVILSPLTLGLSNGAVDVVLKKKRERLANEINGIAKRLADLKNGDIEQAKKEGIRIPEEQLAKSDTGTVVKSFILGMIVPFYSTYQGHKAEELEIELAGKITELKMEMARNGISSESTEEAGDSSVVTGDGEQIVSAKAEEAQETPADAEIGDAEGESLTVKTVEVGERSELESAETEVKVSNESVQVSMEGVMGGVKGFLLGSAGAIVGSIAGSVAAGPVGSVVGAHAGATAVNAGMKAKRETLKKDILNIAKRLADLKNGDIERAKKEGIRVNESDRSPVGADELVKSALLGNIVPFYCIYQGHKIEELEIDLARKIAELKIEFAKHGVATESMDDAAAAAAAAFAEGAAGAAEAAAAASGEPTEAAADVAEVVEETVAEVAEEAGEAAADAVEEVEAVESTEEAGAIEEGSAEIEELDGDIADIEGHAEKYEQAAATMESLVDALRDAQQTGGLNAQSARFFTIGFESVGVNLIGKPFENDRGETALPSLESFGGSMRRDQATQISMESAQDWLKKIIEVLKRTFQQIKEWVVKFIKAIFDQGERYYQRADKILAATKSARSAAKASTINLGRTGSKIAIGKAVDLSHLGDLKKIAEEAGVRSVAASRAIIQIRQNLNETVNRLAKGTDNDEDMMAFVTNLLSTGEIKNSGDLRSAAFSETYTSGDQKGFATKVLPGNVRLAVVDPSSEASVFRAILGAVRGWRVMVVPQEGGGEEGIEAKTLSIQEIQTVANEVKHIIEAARKAKNELKEEALDLGSVNIPSEASEDRAKTIGKFASATGKSISTASSSIGQLLKYAVGTSGHYLDYAALSLKQYQVQIDPTGEGAKKLAAPAA